MSRTYRYFDARGAQPIDRWRDAAALFHGPIDVRSFGRGLRADLPTIRTINHVALEETPEGAWIEVVAPSFVWGMVRKIVAALREVGAGRLSVDRLRAALAGAERLTLPMAEPEPLVLWEVAYDRPWAYRWTGPNRHQSSWWVSERARGASRRAVLDALDSLGGPGPETTRPVPNARASAPR